MFAASYALPRSSTSIANAYRQIGVETGTSVATPHELILMLFDGFGDAVARARGAMRSKAMESKGKAINHALRIVEEGLHAGLDLSAGGKLAADLDALYRYVALRLTQANLNNDEAALDECMRLIEPVRSAWSTIGAQVNGPSQ